MTTVQKFFDDTLAEMLALSPAVKNLHPLLRKLLEKNLKKNDQKMRQRVLKVLLDETYKYAGLTQEFQKKYGVNPEQYVKSLEASASKDVRISQEQKDRQQAEKMISTIN